jgi:hypothetical protein
MTLGHGGAPMMVEASVAADGLRSCDAGIAAKAGYGIMSVIQMEVASCCMSC